MIEVDCKKNIMEEKGRRRRRGPPRVLDVDTYF